MSIASSPWIKAKTAAVRLGVSVYHIHKLALAGQLKSRVLPAQTPDFLAEDVERLIAENDASRTATATAGT